MAEYRYSATKAEDGKFGVSVYSVDPAGEHTTIANTEGLRQRQIKGFVKRTASAHKRQWTPESKDQETHTVWGELHL